MMPYQYLLLGFIAIVSLILAYQIYGLVVIDAKSRGLKHPRLWGLFSVSGDSGGLLLYLIGRRRYVSDMSTEDQALMAQGKKKILLTLSLAIGAMILWIASLVYTV